MSVECRNRNPKDACHIAGRRAIGKQSERSPLLLCGEQPRATAETATQARRREPGHRALADQTALDRAKGCENWENRVRLRAARVQGFRQRPETNPANFKGLDRLDQMTKASAQPVEFSHDHDIAGPREVESFPHPRTIRAGTGCSISENALTACRAQRIHLKVEALIRSRDTSISNKHCSSYHYQNS